MAPPHSGEMLRFWDLCSHFLFLSVSSSHLQVFCFVHVSFQGLEPENSFLWGLQPKHTNSSIIFWTCSRNRFSIRALKSKLPLNVKMTPQKLYFLLEVTNQELLPHTGGSPGSVFFKMAAAAILIAKNCCQFFTIEPILTKFNGNVASLI